MTSLVDRELTLWDRVEELVDCAPSWDALRLHRLHLIAARIRHGRGKSVPVEIAAEWRRAAMISVAACRVLERVRDAYSGRLLLMKGPEVAALYPDPADRAFGDLDLLVDEPHAAQKSLIDAGFVEIDNGAPHHLPALVWPELPLAIELHRRPNTPPSLPHVSAAMIFDHATSSRTAIDGILAPDPAAHALLLAAHSWSHDPFRRLRDVIDIAATIHDADRSMTDACAREWGWERLWNVTVAVTEAVMSDDVLPRVVRLWARHLPTVRDRTVVEHQLAQLVAPACALPASRAPGEVAGRIRDVVVRRNDEPWAHKIRRVRRVLSDALMDESVHERSCVGPDPVG